MGTGVSDPGPFAVWQFFTGGHCTRDHEGLSAWSAVAAANRLTQTLAAQSGTTCRIIITDSGDHTVWEWRHGEGLVFITAKVEQHA